MFDYRNYSIAFYEITDLGELKIFCSVTALGFCLTVTSFFSILVIPLELIFKFLSLLLVFEITADFFPICQSVMKS